MGVVYRAVDEQLHRPAAVKFLPPSSVADADRLARFKNEARALAALNHPHILTIYEVGEATGRPFIATELVEGHTLRERLRKGPLPLAEAIAVGSQVARALAAAHRRGIVHRDIKPENVMIRADGYVKVLDFGLAELCARASPGGSIVTGGSFETVAATAVGTPAYMSPEQIEAGPIDARSDVFSLGVMLCEAMTGTNPFARGSILQTVSAIGQTPMPAVGIAATLPPRARTMLLRALQKDPAGRYQTADEFTSALEHTKAPLLPSRAARRMSRAAVAAIIAAAVFVVAAALLLWRIQGRQWAREQALPSIERLAGEEKTAAAFPLIHAAAKYLPNDPDLGRVVASATRVVSVSSTPPGALVQVQDYLFPAEPWIRIGTTPLENVRVPGGYLRWRVSKQGFPQSIAAPRPSATLQFDLARLASAPAGMVPIPPGTWRNYLAFLGWLGPYDLPPFFMDRYEVTNRDYQQFVDRGGYSTRKYWRQPFVRDGREVGWDEATSLLRDATGRPGSSTWEGGHYPEGKGDEPVTGVSWSARVNELRNSDDLGDLSFVDYVIKSGRAVMYPIYQYLYERQRSAPPESGPTLRRETVIAWSKDLGRSIDYLETRTDIDKSRIGYLGVSQGAAYGVILAALEDRIKAVVFLDGGYFQTPQPPTGIDQVDFARRLTKPVLMVNGRYDVTFPVPAAQEPLFRMLGTPASDKRLVTFETPHDVRLRRDDLVREVLGWFNKYLGRVN